MNSDKTYSLLEITSLVKQTIEDKFFDYYPIVTEIASLNVNRSGHCYLELIQKDEANERIIAKMRATIWASNFSMINSYFESVTGENLRSGIKVLIKASVVFHELYGFSLNIVDIDPNYTLGDLEREKREILDKLETDGIIDMNKELSLALAPKTIAIISSETAAGYEDFLTQLNKNQHGFVYHTKLFTAFMQGDKVEESIIAALDRIYEYHEHFDLVVIIRGGGSKIELGVFDNYNIAYYITQFPLPVLTGIGHERDTSICDIVAHTSLKTPTAVAEFIIEQSENYLNLIDSLSEEFNSEAKWILEQQQNLLKQIDVDFSNSTSKIITNSFYKLDLLKADFKNTVNQNIAKENSKLSTLKIRTRFAAESAVDMQKEFLIRKKNRLCDASSSYINNSKHRLDISKHILQENNPENILAKGYTYLTKNGKLVKDFSLLNDGDIIVNHSNKDILKSKVVK